MPKSKQAGKLTTITGKPVTIPVGFRVPVSDYQRYSALAQRKGITLSDLLRRLVDRGLEAEGLSQTGPQIVPP